MRRLPPSARVGAVEDALAVVPDRGLRTVNRTTGIIGDRSQYSLAGPDLDPHLRTAPYLPFFTRRVETPR
jgi:hypothetical protein